MSKPIKIVIGVVLFAGLAYFFVLPFINNHLHERKMKELKQRKAEAVAELGIALKKQQAKLKETCDASKVTFLTDSKSKTDGGTKAHANTFSTIKASPKHFILADTVSCKETGSRSFKWKKTHPTYHPKAKNTALALAVLQSVSCEVRCASHGYGGGNSCTATSYIQGKQLPFECIGFLLDELKEKMKK